MTNIVRLMFFVMGTLSACRTDSSKNQPDSLQTELHDDTTRTVVISWDKNFLFDSLDYHPSTLAKADFDQIEKSLIESVKDYNHSLAQGHDDFKINLDGKSIKQLVAVTNAKGEKEVWVNCFCDRPAISSWRTQIVLVKDGGPCNFNFKLNLTTKKVYDLIVNGFA